MQRQVKSQIALLAALFLLALIPRLLMAWKIDVLCNDGTLYVHAAQRLEERDLREGFKELRLNTYPLVLLLLKRIGLDHVTGGEICNVLLASAVVFPLFGWVRRQFDLAIAAFACVLYAIHPTLIEWSPEIIRDPLFWLLATSSIYFFWRAVHEERAYLFLAAGFVLAAAIFTRVEGLFLVPVLLLWAFCRWREVPNHIGRLTFGCSLCLAVGPVLLIAINLWLFLSHEQWEWFRTVPISLAARWLAPSVDSTPIPLTGRLWLFGDAWESGVTPIYLVLVIAGIATRLRVWLRAEHQAIFIFACAVALAMWIHLWAAGQSSERYPLFVLILLMPWASLAVRDAGSWLGSRVNETGRKVPQVAMVAALLIVLGVVGVTDALTSSYGSRRARAQLGTWVHQQFGQRATIVGNEDLSKLVAHYSGAKYHCLSKQPTSSELADVIERRLPTVIMISGKDLDSSRCNLLRQEAIRLGFSEEHGPHVAEEYDRVIIMAKRPATTLR